MLSKINVKFLIAFSKKISFFLLSMSAKLNENFLLREILYLNLKIYPPL
jgi:hypothetical protein